MPTNGMTIDGLNTVSSLTAQDEVPVWDKEASGEPTRKITAQNLTNSVKTLGHLVNTTEMNAAIEQSTAVKAYQIRVLLQQNQQITIVYNRYNTASLIFFANSEGAALYVYSNGYLKEIKSLESLTVTLDSDYKTIHLSSSGTAGHVGVLSTDVAPTIS